MFCNSSSRPAFNSSSGNFPLSAVRSRLRSTVGMSHERLLTAAIQPANELSFALYPCSDSLLLGVSAVELDAPPGLISGSPIFLFFQICIWLFRNFFSCLNFFASPLSTISCSILARHSSVCCPIQDNLGRMQCVHTCPKYSVAVKQLLHFVSMSCCLADLLIGPPTAFPLLGTSVPWVSLPGPTGVMTHPGSQSANPILLLCTRGSAALHSAEAGLR